MGKRLVQGAAAPVYLVDGDGEVIGAGRPLPVQLEPVDAELENAFQGTVIAVGDNLVGPTPAANERICITAFSLQNESPTATTIILKDGLAPAAGRWRILGQNQGDGEAMAFDGQHPLRLSAGNRICLNLSGANQCGYSFQIYREMV